MKPALLRRIELLEERQPAAGQTLRRIAPAWLLDEWRSQGLACEAGDDESIRRAIASYRSQPAG